MRIDRNGALVGAERGVLLGLVLLLAAAAPAGAALPAPDLDDGGIKLPPGFRALVVAEDLGAVRFMAVGPGGDIYIKTRQEGIIALRDVNGDGRAEKKEFFGAGGGTGIAIQDGWLYHSSNTAVFRYKLTPGELLPKGEPETIVSGLPAERQHAAKSFAFDDAGRLFVEVGSPSNAYGEPDRAKGAKGQDPTEFLKTHGGFWRFDPAKPDQKQADGFHYSTGHRHMLSLAWNSVSKAFFVVMHGRDQLNTVDPEHYTEDDNAELPAEEMHVLREGANYGWPFTYYDPRRKARMQNPEYGGDNEKRAEPGKYPDPLVAFPAHWAPLQMAFYGGDQFPAKYRGGAFLAFHGSWNRAPKPQKGYNVVFVPFDEKGMPRSDYEVFADGFSGRGEFTNVREARYRPCGLAVGPDGSLYVADSDKGRIWRIIYVGDPPPSPSPPAKPQPKTGGGAADAAGAALYSQACAVCHMADGTGVPNLQPALVGSKVLAGDPAVLVRLLLYGPDKALPPDRTRDSANQMPVFDTLTNDEMAALLTYLRRRFGNLSEAVTAAQVGAVRTGGAGRDG
jgi:glucose/arabinose dehydrogenase/mono/diheme cytochrome c family protein